MEAAEVSGAGIATIAFLWEEIFNSLGESACRLMDLGLPLSAEYVVFATSLMYAASFSVLLCLHCALFTLAVLNPRGSLCLIPRPCQGPPDSRETEARCLQWACIALYLAACVLLENVLGPLRATLAKVPLSMYGTC